MNIQKDISPSVTYKFGLCNDFNNEQWLANFEKVRELNLAWCIMDYFTFIPDCYVNQMLTTVIEKGGYYSKRQRGTWTYNDFKNNCWYSFVPAKNINPQTVVMYSIEISETAYVFPKIGLSIILFYIPSISQINYTIKDNLRRFLGGLDKQHSLCKHENHNKIMQGITSDHDKVYIAYARFSTTGLVSFVNHGNVKCNLFCKLLLYR